MKAPDKICVAPHQILDYNLDVQSVGHNGAEEYIRKDALLEWVEDWRQLGQSRDFMYAIQILVRHLNSM